MDAAAGGKRETALVGGGRLNRFSSRHGRLSHVYLKDRLQGATEYLRIAGYFRSSIFDLVNEEIESIGKVRVICNADIDPQDINAAKQAREQLLKERWNDVDDSVESFLRRPRYKRLYEILTDITEGRAVLDDLRELEELSGVIKDASLCGLGQTAPNPVLSTLKYFRDEYEAHILEKRCPAGACQKLISYEILPENCVGCTACARVCPVNCISGTVKQIHEIDQTVCIKCGACIQKCKFQAIIKR